MTRLMDIGLEKLSRLVLDMADLAEKSVISSLQSYLAGKNDTQQLEQWSQELRKIQDEIGELSVEMIARHQPVASDLRFVKACMEIAYGFSRFGRYAYDISEVLELWHGFSRCRQDELREMIGMVTNMIRMSVEALARRDVQLGLQVFELDDKVDILFRKSMEKVSKNPNSIPECDIPLLLVMRYLERIADHAAYIGETVSYVVTGNSSI
jgi:phosphate transport system protein